MQKSLLIVESPAKAKTLGKYLGPNFEVLASVGHIKNLPQSKLGVDIENGFEPQYKVIAGKKAVLKRIKDSAKNVDAIYLAPDPDREGEAIAFHLAQELGDSKPIYRVMIHEIIKSAVQKAIENPGKLDIHKYNSQQARRVLDRLVGYLISPILWEKVRRGLSAGRVQSVAVKLIVDREREIQSFDPIEYWSLGAVVLGEEPPPFKTRLHRMDDGQKVEIDNGELAHRIRDEIQSASLKAIEITRKDRRRNPSAPFITSTLQQEAARKLGFTAKRTMRVAQQLYEGIEVGAEGPVGLITYMRTDSTRISNESLEELRAFIQTEYGADNLPKEARVFKSRKNSQDAHEAIRVTGVSRTPDALRPFLDKDQIRLYDLIWKRFVSCQMESAVYDAMTIDIEAGRHVLRATGSRLKFAGFMAVYIEGTDDEVEGDADDDGLLPDIKAGQPLTLQELEAVQHFTQPPPRYSESALIRQLEERGIGRPSTYASILSNIIDRHYVEKESRRLKPTELGVVINDMLIEQFPNLFSESFTATMEEELDQVADGELPWRTVLERYYGELSQRIDHAKEHMQDLKRAGVATDHVCEECGKPMVLKWGRNGQFLACTGYPECKNTKEARIDVMGNIEIEEPEKVDEPCPQCNSELMVKRGKFGKFIACTNYPDCDYTSNYNKDAPGGVAAEEAGDGPKVGDVQGSCTQCGSDMIVKRSRYGLFLGCSSYPECRKTKRLPKKKAKEEEEGDEEELAAQA